MAFAASLVDKIAEYQFPISKDIHSACAYEAEDAATSTHRTMLEMWWEMIRNNGKNISKPCDDSDRLHVLRQKYGTDDCATNCWDSEKDCCWCKTMIVFDSTSYVEYSETIQSEVDQPSVCGSHCPRGTRMRCCIHPDLHLDQSSQTSKELTQKHRCE